MTVVSYGRTICSKLRLHHDQQSFIHVNSTVQTQRIRRRKTSATAVSLFVRWYNPSGKTKVSHLALKPIETVDALQVILLLA